MSVLTDSNDLFSVRLWEEQFSGPGVIKCIHGECAFSVDKNLGCHDACHTRSIANLFQYSFDYLDNIDMGSLDSCSRHRSAFNITTTELDIPLEIEEGCAATCTGCEFYPTSIFPGPGLLECVNGRCSNYTSGSMMNVCPFEALEQASEFWGGLSVAGDGYDSSYNYEVYENINTYFPVVMESSCTLECYGCSFLHRLLRG